MNKRAALLSLIVTTIPVLHSESTIAAVPSIDKNGAPALATCPLGNADRIYHFDKIIFEITDHLKAALAADQQRLDALPLKTKLDIKVLDDPRRIADLKGKVLTFIGALPIADNRLLIEIDEVEYAVVLCPKPV
jgi:hypothetical protein